MADDTSVRTRRFRELLKGTLVNEFGYNAKLIDHLLSQIGQNDLVELLRHNVGGHPKTAAAAFALALVNGHLRWTADTKRSIITEFTGLIRKPPNAIKEMITTAVSRIKAFAASLAPGAAPSAGKGGTRIFPGSETQKVEKLIEGRGVTSEGQPRPPEGRMILKRPKPGQPPGQQPGQPHKPTTRRFRG